jgi:hypothetical protein
MSAREMDEILLFRAAENGNVDGQVESLIDCEGIELSVTFLESDD